ncbi:MAG: hypothetical protein ACFCUQ_09400 [Kiloniellales bacterium]
MTMLEHEAPYLAGQIKALTEHLFELERRIEKLERIYMLPASDDEAEPVTLERDGNVIRPDCWPGGAA